MLKRRRSRHVRFISRSLLLKVTLLAAFAAGILALFVRGYDFGAIIRQGVELLRAAGPVTFFLAMMLLPAVGAPLSFFCLTAGSVFGPQFGMGVVMLSSLAAIAANIALSYLLASRLLHPPLQRLVKWLGYNLPQVQSGDATDLIVLLRVTPGVPFAVQNYLLGLAGVPFARYLVVSCLIALPLNAAIIFFGQALLQGRGRAALIGLLLVLAVIAAFHLVRRHIRTGPGG